MPKSTDKFQLLITYKGDISTLFALREFSSAFSDLDDLIAALQPTGSRYDPTGMRNEPQWEYRDMQHGRGDGPYSPSNAKIVRISLASPLEVLLSVNPGWFALLLAFIVGYDKIRTNVELIRKDAARAAEGIKGLTKDQSARLRVSVSIFLEWLLDQPEDVLEDLLTRYRSIRSRLTNQGTVEIEEIIEVEVIVETDEQ